MENTFNFVEDSVQVNTASPDTYLGHKRILKPLSIKKDLSMLASGKLDLNSLLNSYRKHGDYVTAEIRDKNGLLKSRAVSHNLRTNVGASICAIVMGSAQAPPAIYIGLTANAAGASTADTTLTAEIAASGLTRASSAFTNSAPVTNSTVSQQGSFQLAHTWTYTGATAVTINKIGCFDAAAAGNMWWEAVITAGTVSANGDTIQVTWTFNF